MVAYLSGILIEVVANNNEVRVKLVSNQGIDKPQCGKDNPIQGMQISTEK